MPFKPLLAAVCALSFCQAASATPTYYAFAGVIDRNHTEYADLVHFAGIFSFDASRPDAAPNDPHEGYYPMDSSAFSMNVSFQDGTQWFSDPAASYNFNVHLPNDSADDQLPDHAHFDIEAQVQGQVDRFMGLSFRAHFLTDALPGANGDLHLADFDQALFFYQGLTQIAPEPNDPTPLYGADGHLTDLHCIDGCVSIDGPTPTAIPEPPTVALLFAGLLLPGLLSRAGRRYTTARARRSAIAAAS